MWVHKGASNMRHHVREHWGVTKVQGAGKSALRSRLRSARKQRDLSDISQLDSRISAHILDVLETIAVTPASFIAAYVAMPHEPSVNVLRARLHEMGCTVLIPIVSGDELLWAPDGDEDHWARNTFGTLEPDPSGALPSSQALPSCTAIIVPALAMSQSGFRLGQGKGFYDRALTTVADLEHSPLIIGVTYESEFLPEVPTEEHDIPVDVSVTESTLRWF
jgi:5-formyltetrahydrofolate cyclo-ligase